MRQPFTGVGTALVTPFTKTGALDEASVRALARRQIDKGVHFLVPSVTTLTRLAAIPNVVGVKEASGNIQQMCEVCAAVPPDFIVLSGDDAITLPLMAVGGRGVISVASNEVPREMAQMVEAAERGDFA